MSNSERIRPPWWLKYVNKAMIGLHKLGIGFGGKGPVVLTVPGRKTGKPRTTPVTPMTVDGKRYVVAGLPGSDWAANARAAGEATLQVGRRTEPVRMVEMSTEEARPLLRAVSGRSTVRRRLHQERRPRHRTQSRRVRSARRPPSRVST